MLAMLAMLAMLVMLVMLVMHPAVDREPITLWGCFRREGPDRMWRGAHRVKQHERRCRAEAPATSVGAKIVSGMTDQRLVLRHDSANSAVP